jgi:hypothetical protein
VKAIKDLWLWFSPIVVLAIVLLAGAFVREKHDREQAERNLASWKVNTDVESYRIMLDLSKRVETLEVHMQQAQGLIQNIQNEREEP